MPVRLERIETDVSTLKENLTTLTNTVNRIGGDVSMLKGPHGVIHLPGSAPPSNVGSLS